MNTQVFRDSRRWIAGRPAAISNAPLTARVITALVLISLAVVTRAELIVTGTIYSAGGVRTLGWAAGAVFVIAGLIVLIPELRAPNRGRPNGSVTGGHRPQCLGLGCR